MKRTVAMLLSLVLLLALVPAGAISVSAATSGTTGSCTWIKDGSHLTISGNGAMADYSSTSRPWGTSITSLTIEQGVTTIGSYAFYQCKSLTEVTIPNSVKTIKKNAFSLCSKLGSVAFGSGVTTIESYAFSSCSALKSVVVPDQVTSLGSYAFSQCGNLTTAVISKNLKTVPLSLFAYCSKLTTLTIPKVGGGEYSCFGYWFGATIYTDNSDYVPASLKNVILTNATTVADYAFWECFDIETISLNEGVTTIGWSAFAYCYALKAVMLPSTATYVDRYAFASDSELKDIWYGGTVSQKEKITFEYEIDYYVKNATWHYNVTTTQGHIYDGYCDAECNMCGTVRTGVHRYSNVCDAVCNLCSEPREAPHNFIYECSVKCSLCGALRNVLLHQYDDACTDLTCNICGDTRDRAPHVYDGYVDAVCNLCYGVRDIDYYSTFAVEIPDMPIYTGREVRVYPTVFYDGVQLHEGVDYTLSFSNNINASSKAMVTVTGIGNFAGETASFPFVIQRRDINTLTFDIPTAYYEGGPVIPAVSVTDGTTLLKEGKDYAIQCYNNLGVGYGTLRVVGLGNYDGYRSTSFYISKPESYDGSEYFSIKSHCLAQDGNTLLNAKPMYITKGMTLSGGIYAKSGSCQIWHISPSGVKTLVYTKRFPTTASIYDAYNEYSYTCKEAGEYWVLFDYVWRERISYNTLMSHEEYHLYKKIYCEMPVSTDRLVAELPPEYGLRNTYLMMGSQDDWFAPKSVTWSSSNTSVATVSGGVVTFKKAGTATITATMNGKSVSWEIDNEALDISKNTLCYYNRAGNRYDIYWQNELLISGTDYTLTTSVQGNIKTVTVTGKNLFGGTATFRFYTDNAPYTCRHKYQNTCDTTCDRCGATRTTTHDYADATCTAPKTCTICGATEGAPQGHWYFNACDTTCNGCGFVRQVAPHPYEAATCYTPKTCSICGVTEGAALGHEYAAATCVSPKKCIRCSATSGSKLGHSYSKATCAVPATCERCGVTSGGTLAHKWLEPTCAVPSTCKDCGATTGGTLDHYWLEATCTAPKTCEDCGATEGKALPHTYKKVTVKATATKDGSAKNICTECGYTASKVTTIYKASKVSLSKTSYTYNGKVQKPSVIVKDAKGNTISTKHYTVTYSAGCKNAGTYTVTITFKGNYSGIKTLSYKIKPIDISTCRIGLSKTSYTYNGKAQKPSVIVKNANGTKLTTSSYSVTYASGCKNVGTYKVTVKMKGNYTGTKTLTFKINPVKTTITKATAVKKTLQLTIAKKSAQVTGYEVQYSTSKNFKTYKTKTLTSYKKNTLTLSGLKAKTTYYVRVRTYKTVGSKKYYSGWTIIYLKTK